VAKLPEGKPKVKPAAGADAVGAALIEGGSLADAPKPTGGAAAGSEPLPCSLISLSAAAAAAMPADAFSLRNASPHPPEDTGGAAAPPLCFSISCATAEDTAAWALAFACKNPAPQPLEAAAGAELPPFSFSISFCTAAAAVALADAFAFKKASPQPPPATGRADALPFCSLISAATAEEAASFAGSFFSRKASPQPPDAGAGTETSARLLVMSFLAAVDAFALALAVRKSFPQPPGDTGRGIGAPHLLCTISSAMALEAAWLKEALALRKAPPHPAAADNGVEDGAVLTATAGWEGAGSERPPSCVSMSWEIAADAAWEAALLFLRNASSHPPAACAEG